MPIPQPGSGTRRSFADLPGTFAALFNQYYNPMVFFARKLIHDQLVAEDIVTEVFLRFWKKQNGFHCEKTIKTFLYISTRNACINHREQAEYQARERATLRAITDDTVDSVLSEITRAEVLRDAMNLIECLPVQCRKIVLMSFVLGMNNRQIARRLQLSVNTVRNQKMRGLQLMRSWARACA